MPGIEFDRLDYRPYFRALADRMGLKDWTIEVLDDSPSDSGALASIYCIEGRKVGRVRLSEDFLRDTEERRRHTAVHELAHCLHAVAMHLASRRLDAAAYGDWLLAFEYGIDATADVLAPHMPLPSFVLSPRRTQE
jgi:hypothetical protein